MKIIKILPEMEWENSGVFICVPKVVLKCNNNGKLSFFTGFDVKDNGQLFKALYMGCYKYELMASGIPAIPGLVHPLTSPQNCALACKAENYTLVGLGNNKHCMCSNNLAILNK